MRYHNSSDLVSLNQHICIKTSVTENWQISSVKEVLSYMKCGKTSLSKEEKQRLPVFGFNKKIGERTNAQLYPCSFLVLELDTPNAKKTLIRQGDEWTSSLMQSKFRIWYTQFIYALDVPYFWMYLTPSGKGLRFVLKAIEVINTKEEYERAIHQFLQLLFYKTNGEINTAHFDIRINQAWYVPTFEDFFDSKGEVFQLRSLKDEVKTENNFVKSCSASKCLIQRQSDTLETYFTRAVKITKGNFLFIEGQRNNFIHHLACNCNRYGIPQSNSLAFILMNFDFRETEVVQTVRSAYRNNRSEFGRFLQFKNN